MNIYQSKYGNQLYLHRKFHQHPSRILPQNICNFGVLGKDKDPYLHKLFTLITYHLYMSWITII